MKSCTVTGNQEIAAFPSFDFFKLDLDLTSKYELFYPKGCLKNALESKKKKSLPAFPREPCLGQILIHAAFYILPPSAKTSVVLIPCFTWILPPLEP